MKPVVMTCRLALAAARTLLAQASAPPNFVAARKAAAALSQLHSLLVSHDGAVIREHYARLKRLAKSDSKFSAMLTGGTRPSPRRYAQDVIGKTLGFTLARVDRDAQGFYFGGNDMSMMPARNKI